MYHVFAACYDRLTGEIDYAARAGYFDRLLRRYLPPDCEAPLLLDLGCGTGSLSAAMAARGYDVIGVDQSPEMLMQALGKGDGQVQYICQEFTALDLFGTIDATVCALDCLNHLPDETALRRTFERVSLFTEQGGLFVFDVNTPYKHREVLGDHTFIYDMDDVYCVWQNATDPETLVTEITLDFFTSDVEDESGAYYRSGERFCERCWQDTLLCELLEKSGFELLAVYAGDTETPPDETTQRAVYLARKTTPTGTVAG